jgi:small subunit ribosomal protein S20
MPNKTAAKKFVIKSESQRIRNKSIKSEIRKLAKKVELSIKDASKENSMTALKLFEKKGMSAVSKGVFHINTIARKISRLYSKIKQINA